MSVTNIADTRGSNLEHYDERVDLAAAFRWTVRLNWHEAVANHFSLAVSDDGSRFLMNPNQVHFGLVTASNLLLLDANDEGTLERPDAPDLTAWWLHGAIHRNCPHAVCALHVHSKYATALAALQDSSMPAIDQNTALFFNRVALDEEFGGIAFEEEAERCCTLLRDPKHRVLVMGNHGIMVIGSSVADTFNRLYYFEKAAETLVTALSTGRPLRIMSDEIAEKTAVEAETYPGQAERHFSDLKALLDRDEPDYRN